MQKEKVANAEIQDQSESISVYQMKVTLLGVRPLVWRRFRITSDLTLYQLHLIIQRLIGWGNYHLYEFSLPHTYTYGCGGADLENPRGAKLNQLIHAEKQIIYYTYDFGDYWEHEILVEKILKPEDNVKYPICLKGNRACPPEDCGGPSGYMYMLKVIKNRRHPDYREMKEWLGGGFDPLAFDLKNINRELKELSKLWKQKSR